MIFEKIYKKPTWFEPFCVFRKNEELNSVMSFLRKFRNGLLRLNHVVFSEKNSELNGVISFLGKFINRLLGLNIVGFSEKIEN